MSNIVTLVNQLATAIGGDYKTVAASVATAVSKQGDLSTLTTTEKTTLVGALNELKSGLDSVTSTAIDAATVQSMIDTGITALVDGAPDALNTLNEIAAALAEDQTALDGILTALANRLRFDAPQSLTAAQQTQGQENLNVPSKGAFDGLSAGVGDYGAANFVATYNAAKV